MLIKLFWQTFCTLNITISHKRASVKLTSVLLTSFFILRQQHTFSRVAAIGFQTHDNHSHTSSLLLSLKERDLETRVEVPVCCVCPRTPVVASSCCPNSSSTERTSIWYCCCCRTASVQMLGFPRTFSSGIGFQKKLRTRRFFLALWLVDVVAGGRGGAPGGGGGRGGGGGA